MDFTINIDNYKQFVRKDKFLVIDTEFLRCRRYMQVAKQTFNNDIILYYNILLYLQYLYTQCGYRDCLAKGVTVKK
ncbi:hypothetical protein GCM10011418_37250 [Sphingobacterium alkalisoli]|nr:hypothetical protein GCM10011418_37250 [Sphingobacterium alkalisoli]